MLKQCTSLSLKHLLRRDLVVDQPEKPNPRDASLVSLVNLVNLVVVLASPNLVVYVAEKCLVHVSVNPDLRDPVVVLVNPSPSLRSVDLVVVLVNPRSPNLSVDPVVVLVNPSASMDVRDLDVRDVRASLDLKNLANALVNLRNLVNLDASTGVRVLDVRDVRASLDLKNPANALERAVVNHPYIVIYSIKEQEYIIKKPNE